MLQKEEKVVVILLILAVLSLIIAYFGFLTPIQAYSNDAKLGERVYVEGTILSKEMTRTGGHLVLRISNYNINVFILKENGAQELYNTLSIGDRVVITGTVAEYRNVREIVVGRARDVART